MSQFSGKCDFYDGFVMIRCDGNEEKITEELKKLKLYIHGKDGRNHLLKSESIKDIIKYYPYLECIMAGDKDNVTIILSSDSFIDEEEKELLQYRIDDALKCWRKCKRKKEPFDQKEYLKTRWYNDNAENEIIKRISKDGDNAKFDDIHLPMSEHYRKEWFEEMVRAGYSEFEAYNWCFNTFLDKEDTIIKRLGRPLKMEEDV